MKQTFATAVCGSIALVALLAPPATAAAINAPVPKSAYISFGGFEWAWASPCGYFGCEDQLTGYNMTLDLSYQSTQGWRVAELADLLVRPAAADFVFAGANVPLNGTSTEGTTVGGHIAPPGDLACATAYFTEALLFNSCDYSDGANGVLYGDPSWGAYWAAESWVLRETGVGVGGVPEPATWALLIAGFALVGAAARRRRPIPAVAA